MNAYTDFISELNRNAYTIVYFTGKSCSVCHSLLPKLKTLVEDKFKDARFIVVDVQETPEISGQLCVFTVPFILVFHFEKEVLRIRGNNALTIIENEIDRAMIK